MRGTPISITAAITGISLTSRHLIIYTNKCTSEMRKGEIERERGGGEESKEGRQTTIGRARRFLFSWSNYTTLLRIEPIGKRNFVIEEFFNGRASVHLNLSKTQKKWEVWM